MGAQYCMYKRTIVRKRRRLTFYRLERKQVGDPALNKSTQKVRYAQSKDTIIEDNVWRLSNDNITI